MAADESDRFVNITVQILSIFFALWFKIYYNTNDRNNKNYEKVWLKKPVKVFEQYKEFWTLFSSDLKPSSVAIIREVYDSENAHIKFEMELERALEAGVSVIVIEPEPLGEETARWIYVGNLLHEVAVYSGLCSIASGLATVLYIKHFTTLTDVTYSTNKVCYYFVLCLWTNVQ